MKKLRFNLVEVIIAFGVLVIAMFVIIGLLPAGGHNLTKTEGYTFSHANTELISSFVTAVTATDSTYFNGAEGNVSGEHANAGADLFPGNSEFSLKPVDGDNNVYLLTLNTTGTNGTIARNFGVRIYSQASTGKDNEPTLYCTGGPISSPWVFFTVSGSTTVTYSSRLDVETDSLADSRGKSGYLYRGKTPLNTAGLYE